MLKLQSKKGIIAILTGGGDVPGLNPAMSLVDRLTKAMFNILKAAPLCTLKYVLYILVAIPDSS